VYFEQKKKNSTTLVEIAQILLYNNVEFLYLWTTTQNILKGGFFVKKIITILLTLTVLLSLFALTTAFAVTREVGEVTWTQDFEGLSADQVKNANPTPSYSANGIVMSGASSGNVALSTDGGINGSQAGYFYRSNTANNASCKVLIDQSAFEVGKTYVIQAMVNPVPSSTNTNSYHQIRNTVLEGTGYAQTNIYDNYMFVPVNKWTAIETKPFLYTEALKNVSGGINARLDDASIPSGDSATKIMVDNVRVIEVKSHTNQTFNVEDAINTIDFENIYGFESSEYISNSGNKPRLTALVYTEKGQEKVTKALQFTPKDVGASRLILPNIFTTDNLGESYKVTMKIYIPGTTQEGTLKIGTKVNTNDNSHWNSDTSKYEFGPSGKKITLNQWSTIEFFVTSGYNGNNPANDYVDAIAFTYNSVAPNGVATIPASASFPMYYIDDIKFTPINYFADDSGNEIETEIDAGYYAQTPDADEKEGAVIVNSYISNQGSVIQRYDGFGMYVYRQGDEENKVDVYKSKAEGKDALIAAKGYINVLIEEIGEEFFNEKILAVPYVVMRGRTFLGEPFTFCVNDVSDLKWLGTKEITE